MMNIHVSTVRRNLKVDVEEDAARDVNTMIGEEDSAQCAGCPNEVITRTATRKSHYAARES